MRSFCYFVISLKSNKQMNAHFIYELNDTFRRFKLFVWGSGRVGIKCGWSFEPEVQI